MRLSVLIHVSSFLDGIERIASRDYSPTDDDVIRARLRTVGVQEYKLDLDEKCASCKSFDPTESFTRGNSK